MEPVIHPLLATTLSAANLMVRILLASTVHDPFLIQSCAAFKPSPEAGTWNQAYFEALVKNAVPSF